MTRQHLHNWSPSTEVPHHYFIAKLTLGGRR